MSVDEFWKSDPDLFWAYRFSYYNKIKNQQEIFNNNAWLQGAYFYEAISVALCNSFGKQKVQYTREPYGLKPKQTQEQQTNALVEKLKGRISQVKSIFKNKQCSTADEGTTLEGGEKINE